MYCDPWNEVSPGLFIGDFTLTPRAETFDAVLTLGPSPLTQPEAGVRHKHVKRPDIDEVEIGEAWAMRLWLAGNRVLIRSHRFSPLAAQAAVAILVSAGATPEEANAIVRRARNRVPDDAI